MGLTLSYQLQNYELFDKGFGAIFQLILFSVCNLQIKHLRYMKFFEQSEDSLTFIFVFLLALNCKEPKTKLCI